MSIIAKRTIKTAISGFDARTMGNGPIITTAPYSAVWFELRKSRDKPSIKTTNPDKTLNGVHTLKSILRQINFLPYSVNFSLASVTFTIIHPITQYPVRVPLY